MINNIVVTVLLEYFNVDSLLIFYGLNYAINKFRGKRRAKEHSPPSP